MKRFALWIASGCLAATSCTPEVQEMTFEVTAVRWASPSEFEVGATVILEEQRLQNGILNSFYTEVDRATTDGTGPVTLSTVRSNVLSIRIRIEQEGCFDELAAFNPETLNVGATPNLVELAIMPQCQVNAEVVNDGSNCPASELIYRWIPRDVEGAATETRWTCNTGWQDVQPGESELEYCWISGETWLLYQRHWSCVDSTHIDSTWCPPGGLITLTLD
jgi:hypothetical protein